MMVDESSGEDNGGWVFSMLYRRMVAGLLKVRLVGQTI